MPDEPQQQQPQPRATQAIDLGRVVGQDGQAATVNVGTTTTTAPGTNASVTQAGTPQARIFNFNIPRGQEGVPGSTGDPLNFPPMFTPTYSGGVNNVTIPGYTYAAGDNNKLIFLSGLTYDWVNLRCMLNVNSLGASYVFGLENLPQPHGNTMGMRYFDRNSRTFEYFPHRPFASPIILRRIGTAFYVLRRDDLWLELRSQKWGSGYNQYAGNGSSYTNLTTTGVAYVSTLARRHVLPMAAPAATGICQIRWQFRTKYKGGPYSIFADYATQYERRFLVRQPSWNATNPACTLRFQEDVWTRNEWNESAATNQSMTTGYRLRCSKHLVDLGIATVSPGQVDIAYPGGVGTEMEITFKISWPRDVNWWARGGLFPSTADSQIRYTRWHSFLMTIEILDVKAMILAV